MVGRYMVRVIEGWVKLVEFSPVGGSGVVLYKKWDRDRRKNQSEGCVAVGWVGGWELETKKSVGKAWPFDRCRTWRRGSSPLKNSKLCLGTGPEKSLYKCLMGGGHNTVFSTRYGHCPAAGNIDSE